MAKLPGSIWIDGAMLSVVNSNGDVYNAFAQARIDGNGANRLAGSLWVEDQVADGESLAFIHANRLTKIYLKGTLDAGAGASGAGALVGSLWQESTDRLAWVGTDGEKYYITMSAS